MGNPAPPGASINERLSALFRTGSNGNSNIEARLAEMNAEMIRNLATFNDRIVNVEKITQFIASVLPQQQILDGRIAKNEADIVLLEQRLFPLERREKRWEQLSTLQ